MAYVIPGLRPGELIKVFERTDWRARSAKSVSYSTKGRRKGYNHHTVSSADDWDAAAEMDALMRQIVAGNEPADEVMRGVQNYHMDVRDWSDFAYNMAVDPYGFGYVGRGWDRNGGHTLNENTESGAIVALGNYTVIPMSTLMLRGFASLWRQAIHDGWFVSNVELMGHRDAKKYEPATNTRCPGDAAYAQLDLLRSMVFESNPGPSMAPHRYGPSASATVPSEYPGLRWWPGRSPLGDAGPLVHVHQHQLNLVYALGIAAGKMEPLDEDGWFAEKTDARTKMFQTWCNEELRGPAGLPLLRVKGVRGIHTTAHINWVLANL